MDHVTPELLRLLLAYMMYGACKIAFLARESSGSNTLFPPQHNPQLKLTPSGHYRLSQPPEGLGLSHDESLADTLPASEQHLVAPRPLSVVKDSVVCQMISSSKRWEALDACDHHLLRRHFLHLVLQASGYGNTNSSADRLQHVWDPGERWRGCQECCGEILRGILPSHSFIRWIKSRRLDYGEFANAHSLGFLRIRM
jgi:hypothetical protein